MVISYLHEDPVDTQSISSKLSQVAKEKGSSDNITTIVVFLRPVEDMKELRPGSPTGLLNVRVSINPLVPRAQKIKSANLTLN